LHGLLGSLSRFLVGIQYGANRLMLILGQVQLPQKLPDSHAGRTGPCKAGTRAFTVHTPHLRSAPVGALLHAASTSKPFRAWLGFCYQTQGQNK
jgi:hypothetical protein